ncbi:MAG TPA: SGNH/GDSL hydrolase family protein [Symbiobacteriaceae bacterium]|jgi:lysophospholipase L1-like esterase|nr:SGNH/GDSL hydrolase family protein [Symbiobacteriaceae bacterium]
MQLSKSDKLVMIGDSITDVGRKQPVGEGTRGEALGKGYVALVDAALGAVYPERQIRVVNMGTSGHTVRDLAGRWQSDVLDLQPDWLSIKIGINDVWRQFDQPLLTHLHVYLDEYRRTLTNLVAVTKPRLKGLVLLSPYYLEPNRQDPMRAAMDRYGAVVREVAAEYGAIFVDTQAAMDQLMEHYYPASLAWDRVHPNLTGHMAIARAFLKAIEFEW